MRRRNAISALMLTLTLLACGSDDGVGPDDAIIGVYDLEMVNGWPLPYLAVQVEADKVEVVGGAITLNGDGTFTDVMTFQITEGGAVRTEDDMYQGTFLKDGSGATLTPAGYMPYTVSITGSTLTLMIGEIPLTYKR
jgi:hypothetical protein